MAVTKSGERLDLRRPESGGTPDSVPAMADSNPANRPKCPPSARNRVRHASEMVSAITPESRPSWTGARSVCIGTRKINLSTALAGQNVGVRQVADRIWLVSFMQYDSGFFDHETCRITSAENPFSAKVLPM